MACATYMCTKTHTYVVRIYVQYTHGHAQTHAHKQAYTHIIANICAAQVSILQDEHTKGYQEAVCSQAVSLEPNTPTPALD